MPDRKPEPWKSGAAAPFLWIETARGNVELWALGEDRFSITLPGATSSSSPALRRRSGPPTRSVNNLVRREPPPATRPRGPSRRDSEACLALSELTSGGYDHANETAGTAAHIAFGCCVDPHEGPGRIDRTIVPRDHVEVRGVRAGNLLRNVPCLTISVKRFQFAFVVPGAIRLQEIWRKRALDRQRR